MVLNQAMRPMKPGETGEIYIKGVGLSPGYWKDPDKTSEVFLSTLLTDDPSDRIYKTGDLARIGEDGLIYFLGRTDSQIKSGGYRIELGEVETALNNLSFLKETAVVAVHSNGFESKNICCAYSPFPDAEVTPAILRGEMSKYLPSYMLPSRWMAFDRLPHNSSGKIDRRQIRELFQKENH